MSADANRDALEALLAATFHLNFCSCGRGHRSSHGDSYAQAGRAATAAVLAAGWMPPAYGATR